MLVMSISPARISTPEMFVVSVRQKLVLQGTVGSRRRVSFRARER